MSPFYFHCNHKSSLKFSSFFRSLLLLFVFLDFFVYFNGVDFIMCKVLIKPPEDCRLLYCVLIVTCTLNVLWTFRST